MFRIWYKSVNGYGEKAPTTPTYQIDTNGGTKEVVIEEKEPEEEKPAVKPDPTPAVEPETKKEEVVVPAEPEPEP